MHNHLRSPCLSSTVRLLPWGDDVAIPFPLLLLFTFVMNPLLKERKFYLHGGLLNFILTKVTVFYCECGENNLSPVPQSFLVWGVSELMTCRVRQVFNPLRGLGGTCRDPIGGWGPRVCSGPPETCRLELQLQPFHGKEPPAGQSTTGYKRGVEHTAFCPFSDFPGGRCPLFQGVSLSFFFF